MVTEQQLQLIPEEEIFNKLKRRRSGNLNKRFRLNLPVERVYRLLIAACRAEVELRYRKFNLTPAYQRHIYDIAQWLTGNESTFGLLLNGNCGNGKTTMIRALQNLIFLLRSDEPTDVSGKLPIPGFRIVPAKDLVLFSKAYINMNGNAAFINDYKVIRDIEFLAIDDLGTEPRESMNFGEIFTSTIDIINYRYDNQFCTMATSNLSTQEILDHYDIRFAERLREMMHIVSFGNEPSFR